MRAATLEETTPAAAAGPAAKRFATLIVDDTTEFGTPADAAFRASAAANIAPDITMPRWASRFASVTLALALYRSSQQAKLLLPIDALDNQVSKQVRIRRLGSFLAQRQFRFKARSGETALLVDQLRDFPVGEHDDGPDALEKQTAGRPDGY